jgi:transposase-like protein
MCSCSRSSSSSLWRCCVLYTGPILVLPRRELMANHAPGFSVCSSLAPQTTAPPVVWPPMPRQLEDQRLQMSRPWPEVKSRRGVPKRVNTAGFACPNQQCPYFGITDDRIHALVGDGKHGRAERIQTFRCQACRATFTSRRHTPLYRLKTPSHQIAMVLSALAEGLDPSAAERVFGFRQATISSLSDSRWRARANHARALLLPSAPPTPAVG